MSQGIRRERKMDKEKKKEKYTKLTLKKHKKLKNITAGNRTG